MRTPANMKCYCGSPAYQHFLKIECSNKACRFYLAAPETDEEITKPTQPVYDKSYFDMWKHLPKMKP